MFNFGIIDVIPPRQATQPTWVLDLAENPDELFQYHIMFIHATGTILELWKVNGTSATRVR